MRASTPGCKQGLPMTHKDTKTQATPKAKPSGNVTLWLLTWIAMIAIASFTVWQKENTDHAESAHMKALVKTLESQEEVLNTLTGMIEAHDQQFAQIAEHSNDLVEAIKSLSQQINQDNQTWRIVQVQSYIEQAMVEISLMQDPKTAFQLLSAAQYQIQQLNDPKLAPLNDAINNDKNALLEALPVDKTELTSAINVIIQEVPNFPQQTLEINNLAKDDASTTNGKFNWKHEIKTTLNELRGLIQIRRHGEPITPYISNDQRYLINENLQLILQQANFAALQNKQGLYTQQINIAIKWLQTYYDTSNLDVQDTITFLQKINTQVVAPVMPQTFQSLEAWNQYLINSGNSEAP